MPEQLHDCMPLLNSSIEECEKYSNSKTTWLNSCQVQKDYAPKTSSPVRIKKSLVPGYATIAKLLNVVKRTCKGTEFCMLLLSRKK